MPADQEHPHDDEKNTPESSEKQPSPQDQDAEWQKGVDFPLVGIGASAGGLDALKRLFDALPADSGMAFVLIQHLAPDQKSLTAELLTTHTAMPVEQVEDNMTIQINRVYVIPPNKFLTLHEGALHLNEPVLQKGIRMPIDHFFRSLATEQQNRSIGILLSGTGTDGTLGLKEIKAKGGMAMAQNPQNAQYNGMVRSAIDAGLVDYILSIAEMPKTLTEYVHHAPQIQTRIERLTQEKAPNTEQEALRTILNLLRTHTQFDFRCYKQGTLLRRIGRRMGIKHIENISEYADFVRGHQDERRQLSQDLLISVTSFFRESEAFEVLANQAVAKLVQNKPADQPLRVWVPGCATGEEAYSLAMLFTEQLEALDRACPLQIFATDIDGSALEIGRTGIYPENIATDVSPKRLERFFFKEDSTYRVSQPIRETVTFAQQNLIADPPFSKLDLISCRNLLIYLQPELQRKVLALFHFALAEGGYLFLGSTETIGTQTDLFKPIDKKWRLYQRLAEPRHNPIDFPLVATEDRTDETKPAPSRPSKPHVRLGEITQRRLLEEYVPAAVLIDRNYQIHYYQGPTDRYLKRPSGAPTDDLMAQIRQGLHAKLRTALHKVAEENRRVSISGGQVRYDEDTLRQVKLTIEPVKVPQRDEELLLVVFEDEPEPAEKALKRAEDTGSEETIVRQLEQELKHTKEDLQGTIEELESVNEEQKSANEEITSMNEELQSSNEELETAKEELQSMNEELSTLNSQLQNKVEELEGVNNDVNNLLASTDMATLFLDRQLHIKRFTPPTRQLFNVIASDIGRPVGDISHNFRDGDLLRDAETVLDKLTPLEREVSVGDERWYIQRILPYRTQDKRIEGVVVTFVDITERKRMEQAMQRLATVMRDSNDAVMVLDFDGKILDWNRGAELIYGWPEQEAVGKSIFELTPEARHEETRTFLESLAKGEPVAQFESQRCTKDNHLLEVWLTVTAIEDEAGRPTAVATTERDITERKQTETALRQAKAEAERINAQKTQFLAAASHDLRQPLQALNLLNTALTKQLEDKADRDLINQQSETLRVMEGLLNALLDIGQLETGTLTPKTTAFSAETLFADLNSEFGAQARDKGLKFKIRPCNVLIRSDRALLERILHNFLANAVKHTKTGKILIGCRRRSANLRLEVWDTGVGIDEDQLKAIFEEFYQLDNPARERSKGLGLGLAIADRLARLLNHRLDVRSTPGKGSVFAVEVPIATEADSEQQETESAPQPTPIEGPVRILLIEDDPDVAGALKMLFDISGFQSTWAETGDKALAQAQDGASIPNMIISDYRLPGGKSGFQVIKAIRKTLGQDIPGILLTGDTGIQPRDAEKQGCWLLHKPVTGDKLIELINRLTA